MLAAGIGGIVVAVAASPTLRNVFSILTDRIGGALGL
jgi:hypothetical protein